MPAPSLIDSMRPALPHDAGRPRVQRIVRELPQIHIEPVLPSPRAWSVSVEGLVERPLELSLAQLAGLAHARSAIDLHCIWGWSRPECRWEGVPGSAFVASCRPLPQATHAMFCAADSRYASCVSLDDAQLGMLAFKLDGERLAPEHGGPLRFVGPAHLWAYKGVKWLDRVIFFDHLEPGFWESKVGDVEGRVPASLLALFDHDRALARSGSSSPAETPVLRELEEIAVGRRVQPKDCRDCRNYEPSDDGMAYGWCGAHKKFVKLYHPTGGWYSQCQIMSLRRVRPAG